MMKGHRMSKHTPGPWSTSDQSPPDTIWGADESTEVCHFRHVRTGWQEHAANARLIAAAPDLLSALNDLFTQCAMIHKHWGDGDNTSEAKAAIDRARALIASIEGGAK